MALAPIVDQDRADRSAYRVWPTERDDLGLAMVGDDEPDALLRRQLGKWRLDASFDVDDYPQVAALLDRIRELVAERDVQLRFMGESSVERDPVAAGPTVDRPRIRRERHGAGRRRSENGAEVADAPAPSGGTTGRGSPDPRAREPGPEVGPRDRRPRPAPLGRTPDARGPRGSVSRVDRGGGARSERPTTGRHLCPRWGEVDGSGPFGEARGSPRSPRERGATLDPFGPAARRAPTMHALRSLARAAAPCLLVPVLASAPQEVEYDCGAFDVIHTAGRINTFVFDAHAQQQGTTSDDIYLHAAQLEARFADFVSCPTEECASTYPEWDCTKYAHLDMNSGSHFTFYDEGLVGTYVIFVNTTVQRGCVPCFE